MQVYCESAQDLYDSVIQGFRIAEDTRVLLPLMICGDGFRLSHTAETIQTISEEEVCAFLPDYKPTHQYLDPKDPMFIGLTPGDVVIEYRYKMAEAMSNALDVIEEAGTEFFRLTGRRYGLVDPFMVDGAEVLLFTVGSMTGTARVAVKRLREQGKPVGLVNLRTVRPFPHKIIREVCKGKKAIALVERNISVGSGLEGGAMLPEVLGALYNLRPLPSVQAYIAGLGGRDITVQDFVLIGEELLASKESLDSTRAKWVGLHI